MDWLCGNQYQMWIHFGDKSYSSLGSRHDLLLCCQHASAAASCVLWVMWHREGELMCTEKILRERRREIPMWWYSEMKRAEAQTERCITVDKPLVHHEIMSVILTERETETLCPRGSSDCYSLMFLRLYILYFLHLFPHFYVCILCVSVQRWPLGIMTVFRNIRSSLLNWYRNALLTWCSAQHAPLEVS